MNELKFNEINVFYLISTNGKKTKVKILGNEIYKSIGKYEIIGKYLGRVENFEKGYSSLGYWVLFEF